MGTNILSTGKIRVGILRGGPSHEYDASLLSGATVRQHLPEKYDVHDIFISRDGDWHSGGLVRNPQKIVSQVDVVFNALHGRYGEDGKVQAILEMHNIPYTGSKVLGSALGIHKGLAKKMFQDHGIKTPIYLVLHPKDNVRGRIVEIFQSFPQPVIVKPINGGSLMATTVTKDFSTFEKAVEDAFRHSGSVLVEEYISGREATCGVLDSGDGKTAYGLFPIEVKSAGQGVYPSTFSPEIKKAIQELSLEMHMALGLRHYSRSDFIVTPSRGIYALETNSLPKLTQGSLFSQSLLATGVSFSDFLDHVVMLALK